MAKPTKNSFHSWLAQDHAPVLSVQKRDTAKSLSLNRHNNEINACAPRGWPADEPKTSPGSFAFWGIYGNAVSTRNLDD